MLQNGNSAVRTATGSAERAAKARCPQVDASTRSVVEPPQRAQPAGTGIPWSPFRPSRSALRIRSV